jgi:hypothetical protein
MSKILTGAWVCLVTVCSSAQFALAGPGQAEAIAITAVGEAVLTEGIHSPETLTTVTGLSLEIFSEPDDDPPSPPSPELTGIRPYKTNNSYWEYRGKPVLLIGGFSENNEPFLSKKADLVKELNATQANGGNYIRNTMATFPKTRVQGVFPFVKLSNGKFDLNKVNSDYYDYLRVFLEETHKRQILVQLELWDPWYYRGSHWAKGPWAPRNNVNYTSAATGIPDVFEGLPYKEVNKFYYSIEDSNKAIVLKYQRDFVRKMLEVAKPFDHVIYQIENEEMKKVQPLSNDWAGYWAQFIRDNAGGGSYVTHMPSDYNLLSSEKQDYTLKAMDNRGKHLFGFLDISQGGMEVSNQKRFEMIRDFVRRVRIGPKNRPVNSTKIYKWRSSTSKESNDGIAINRMWHNVFSGVAAVRFHRPGAGIDQSSVALRQTKSMRYFADRVDLTKMKPDTDLLSSRSADEAYAMSPTSGKVHAVYFTGLSDSKVSINLKAVSGELKITWYDTMSGKSQTGEKIFGGGTRTLLAPSDSRWLAVLE